MTERKRNWNEENQENFLMIHLITRYMLIIDFMHIFTSDNQANKDINFNERRMWWACQNNIFIPHSLPLNCITHVSHKFKLIAVLLDVYVIANFAIYLHSYCMFSFMSLNYSLPDYLFTCLLLLHRKLWAEGRRTEQNINFLSISFYF